MNFDYLDTKNLYFDSACQTLRPSQVIEAQDKYFKEYNACAGRVKYAWGERVDRTISETREMILDMVGLSKQDYVCAFTANTTYGINLVLQQLPRGKFTRIVTSEIEHNSVFIPSITAAKRLGIERQVLPRGEDGSLMYSPDDLDRAIVIVNSVSNIDGRKLTNIKELVEDTHKHGGIVLIDAAQTFAHDISLLRGIKIDAFFASSHKMYGPSLGIIVITKELLKSLDTVFLGGGTVQDVQKDTYELIEQDEELYARLEPGLQNFSGIIGLNAALTWRATFKPEGLDQETHQKKLASMVFENLKANKDIVLINKSPSEIISFYSPKIDAHRLALFLSSQNIMARSGTFCCHYYLKNLKKYPPLLRLSVGLHNTEAQTEKMLSLLNQIINNA